MTEQPNTDLDGVLRRVKKLLAMANDGRGNPNEAAAAARMAESIMRKYQIDHADVIEQELKSADAFDTADIGSTLDVERFAKSASGWASFLSLAIARLHDCKCGYVWTPQLGIAIRFSGYKADAAVAKWTYIYVVNTMVAASKVYATESGAGRSQLTSFRLGFVLAVCKLVEVMIDDKVREMQEASASRSLVLVKSAAVAQHFGAQRTSQGRVKANHGSAFGEGRHQGSQVNVGHRPLAGTQA